MLLWRSIPIGIERLARAAMRRPPASTDLFVVGGGPAGLATAIAARQRGVDVIVAEHSDRDWAPRGGRNETAACIDRPIRRRRWSRRTGYGNCRAAARVRCYCGGAF